MSHSPAPSPSTAIVYPVGARPKVVHNALLPPGAALAGGFVVAQGSALVGTVFPNRQIHRHLAGGGRALDQGWTAVLTVTGNPIDVTNAYLQQARSLGFDHVTGGCELSRYRPGHYPQAVPTSGAATGIGCFLNYSTAGSDQSGLVTWDFHLAWGDLGGETASAVMSYGKFGHATPSPSGGRRSITGNLPASVRTPNPSLIGVGGALDNHFFTARPMPLSEMVLVQPGSRLAAPLARLVGDPGFQAVLRVDANPDDVLHRYMGRAPGDKLEDRTDRVAGQTVRTVWYELAGSVDTKLVLVSSPTKSWLLVSRSWEP